MSFVATVAQLTEYIKNRLERDENLQYVSVKGEISNYVLHASGHMYFTLKDEESQIKAAMFRGANARLTFRPENGMKVILTGSISVYEPRGEYQIVAVQMRPEGVGDLYMQFEALKKRLAQEGLFDEAHKKPLPAYPKRIGVITSANGAAVRDIMTVAGRRCPFVQLVLYPALVQGAGTEEALVKALDYFDRSTVDVVIIGRGGGSMEDLWGFNGERLARRIFAMQKPVISAVGHETDFTIADFVADRRAPTPSAAAEIAVPDVRTMRQYLDGVCDRVLTGAEARLNAEADGLSDYAELFGKKGLERLFALKEERLKGLTGKIESLSPLSVLSRGFAVATKEGKTIKKASELTGGDEVSLRFSDGEKQAVIKE